MLDTEICTFIEKNGYKVFGVIGSGGYSTCYDVFSPKYNQHFVCKAINFDGNSGDVKKRSYNNELSTLTNIIHPNIIQVFQTFSNETHHFLILEYCSNGDFNSLIERNGPITDEVLLLEYILRILDGLSYLELNNISHRDIKPSNIFIDKYGRPKIADFGLSQVVDKEKLCEEYGGSLVFISPEILLRKPYDSFKSDVWSFGITIYYIATGKYPFPVTDTDTLKNSIKHGITNIYRGINSTVRKLVTDCLSINPNKRPSFSEMRSIVEKSINKISELPSLYIYDGSSTIKNPIKTKKFVKSKSIRYFRTHLPIGKLEKCQSENINLPYLNKPI